MASRRSPFVYWAQTSSNVSLRIDLKNAKDHRIKIEDKEIMFSAEGVGAHGMNTYAFELDLYSAVLREQLNNETKPLVKLFDDRVQISLKKESDGWWPRLTAQPQKPAWLKVDFELWQPQDPDDVETETRDLMSDYPKIYENLQKDEIGYRKENMKKVYLILYNLFQFIGFFYVVSVMGVRYSKLGVDSIPSTYENVGVAMKFLHLMMWLEVMNPLFGYTKGGALVPFFQVLGRCVILFAMIEAEPRMQTKPVVFYLFLVWSSVEIIRYPYYISQLCKMEMNLLTWLRYTIWIPLYPLGILCEAITILRNLPYFYETQKFSIALPNAWNFTFHMPTFMKVHFFLLTVPGLYLIMNHMYKSRKNKLGPKVVIKKFT